MYSWAGSASARRARRRRTRASIAWSEIPRVFAGPYGPDNLVPRNHLPLGVHKGQQEPILGWREGWDEFPPPYENPSSSAVHPEATDRTLTSQGDGRFRSHEAHPYAEGKLNFVSVL